MILLGRDWMAVDMKALIHQTRVRKDPRGNGLWWWHCSRCPRRFGYGNRWYRIVAAANRHAIGRSKV
jgi:hypothetical protein